jgi:hypothetical protein
VYEDRVVLHCGAVHVSKDTIEWKGEKIYGALSDATCELKFKSNADDNNDDVDGRKIVETGSLIEGQWGKPDERLLLTSVSQEHGTVKVRIDVDVVFVSKHTLIFFSMLLLIYRLRKNGLKQNMLEMLLRCLSFILVW